MRLRFWMLGPLVSSVLCVQVASAHSNVDPGPVWSPSGLLSTSGDYASDTFGDPWDFANDEDVPPILMVGSENSYGISRSNAGTGSLTVASVNNSTIKLVRTWGVELPWGRDGLLHPVDADRYTTISFAMCLDADLNMAVHYWNAAGDTGLRPFYPKAGCATYSFDLRDTSGNPNGFKTPWTGKMTRIELLRGGASAGGDPLVKITLDWVRLHRPDASVTPPSGVPLPRVLTPNEEGGADYASQTGNPWDFNGPDDVVSMDDITNVSYTGGDLTGTTYRNDSFVELPLRGETNPDRYHRATVDVCYDGPMSFANAPGGGMNARFAWLMRGQTKWSETQDIIIVPGCNRMTVDLSTSPAVAVNDETTILKSGWRGQRLERLRFDLNEDPGARNFTLREIKMADDAAFSGTYDISFLDAAGVGGTADIYVTTNRGQFDGTRIAQGITVQGGVNTFRWDGTTQGGSAMPNGTYWVYIVMSKSGKVGTATSTGPVRLERPVPATPSYYVPISPSRILDTRTGIGGNITPLGPQVFTEVDVTGVGGVPETGVTAVVMNVTVDRPSTDGYLAVSPSGEGRPLVSNLNFAPRQTVPNLVTVKVGANGKVDVFNFKGFTDVVADVVGYYTSTPVARGLFTPLTPGRVLDTRDGTGRGGVVAPVAQGEHIDVRVTGTRGVPDAGVSAAALNVTVDGPTAAGFITTWPTGERMPDASTHNFTPGLTVANLVIAKVGAGGMVSMFNSAGSTDLVADVVGYFSSSGGAFVPVTPTRIADTRDGTGGLLGQVGLQSSVSVAVAVGNPVPANATGAVVNVTSVLSSEVSFLTVWPSGPGRPVASTLNPRPGVPVPNQAYLKLGDAGRLVIYNNTGSTDVFVDVFGYVL